MGCARARGAAARLTRGVGSLLPPRHRPIIDLDIDHSVREGLRHSCERVEQQLVEVARRRAAPG